MDALPVKEAADVGFRSKAPGRMHACGHDAHTAMLLGAARLLKARERALGGSVRLLFQPAEEGGRGGKLGAQRMVEEGVVEDVAAVFGLHVDPTLPTGVVATRPGTIFAGELNFQAIFRGSSGHAAYPHLTRDPVPAAAAAVAALQALVSRETSPLESLVISVTRLIAGSLEFLSIIPEQATVGGTVRALNPELHRRAQSRVSEVLEAQAKSFGVAVEVEWSGEDDPYYPPTMNDAALVAFSRGVAARMLGSQEVVVEKQPMLVAEDFAFLAQKAPGCFSMLGIRNESLGSIHPLHSSQFLVDEAALRTGAALHAALAIEYLNSKRPVVQHDVREEL